jgi:hypothetical protein
VSGELQASVGARRALGESVIWGSGSMRIVLVLGCNSAAVGGSVSKRPNKSKGSEACLRETGIERRK